MTKKDIVRIAIATAGTAAFALPLAALATSNLDVGLNQVGNSISLGNADIRTTIARIINVLMGLLGIIAVIMILIGGFKWMTAGGNEEKTGEAKKLITAGVIGLVIILASWAIATFVLNQLLDATGASTT